MKTIITMFVISCVFLASYSIARAHVPTKGYVGGTIAYRVSS